MNPTTPLIPAKANPLSPKREILTNTGLSTAKSHAQNPSFIKVATKALTR